MNKTISVNISGQNFLIEENAHLILQNYLNEIRKHCGQNSDVKEVMADIESGIAEKLKSLITQYKEVVTVEDIELLIKVMGTTEDFDREVGETLEDEKDGLKVKRKLYRDTDNAVIAGVCSGLANYFNVDPVIFRILLFLSMFMKGFGVFIYIVLWIVMPEAKNAHQKLEMHGQAPTIAAFEKLGRDLKEKDKKRWADSSVFSKIISAPIIALNAILKACKNIILKVLPVIQFLFGLGLIIFSLLALAGIGIGSLYLLLQTKTNYLLNFVPISELIKTVPFVFLVAGAFFSLAIPTLLLLFGGLAIIRKKNILTFNLVAILMAVWMIIGISCCAFSLRYIPDIFGKIDNYPTLQATTQEIDISGATKLIVDGQDLSIEVVSDSTEKAILSGRKVDLDAIDVKNENSELSFSEKESGKYLCIECSHHPVKLTISGDKFAEIEVKNHATINIKNSFKNTPTFTLDHGSAVYWQDAKVSKFVMIGSNAIVRISGTIGSADLTMSNSDIDLNDLSGQKVKITLSGNDSTIHLSGKIDNLNVSNGFMNTGNMLNASDLQVQKMTLETTGAMTVIAGKIEEIDSIYPASVNLIYDGSTKLTGDSSGFKKLEYKEISRSEFFLEKDKLESNLNEDNPKNKDFISTDQKYFVLNRGELSESDFEDLTEVFQLNEGN